MSEFKEGDVVRFIYRGYSFWGDDFMKWNGGSDIFTVKKVSGDKLFVNEKQRHLILYTEWFELVKSNKIKHLPYEKGII